MSWLDKFFKAYSSVQVGGVALAPETTINFVGATVVDDPTNARTTVTVTGGGGASPVGAAGQLQYYATSTTFGGASNVTYDGTGLAVNASGYVTFGAASPTTGNIRLPNTGTVKSRNAGNTLDRTLLSLDAGDVLRFGDNTGSGHVHQYATSWGVYNGASYDLLVSTGVLAVGSSAITFGATPHTTAKIAFSYAATDVILGAKASDATNQSIIARTAIDTVEFMPFNNEYTVRYNGNNLIVQGRASAQILAGASQIQAFIADGTDLFIGTNAALNSQHSTVTIAPSTSLRIGTPIGGYSSSPLKFAVSNITPSLGANTLTAAQYACPAISCNGTPGGSFGIVAPLVVGAAYDVYNNTPSAMAFGGSTGTSVPIASGTKARCVCFDGANYR